MRNPCRPPSLFASSGSRRKIQKTGAVLCAGDRAGDPSVVQRWQSLSGAVLQTLTDFFGRDKVAFTVVSGRSLNGTPIAPRRFLSFSQARQEVIDARVWGGIHFRTADRQGAWLGRQVARYVRTNYFLPIS